MSSEKIESVREIRNGNVANILRQLDAGRIDERGAVDWIVAQVENAQSDITKIHSEETQQLQRMTKTDRFAEELETLIERGNFFVNEEQ